MNESCFYVQLQAPSRYGFWMRLYRFGYWDKQLIGSSNTFLHTIVQPLIFLSEHIDWYQFRNFVNSTRVSFMLANCAGDNNIVV